MLNQYLTPQNILFIPVFLIIISVLVAAHEYGHYLFARIFGMGVEEFAIGFGRKPIWIYRQKKYLIPIEPGHVVRDRLESPATDGYGLESKDRRIIPAEVVDTPTGPAVQESTNFTVRPWPLGGFVRIKGMLPEDDGSETQVPGGFYSKEPWKRFIVLLAGPVFSIIAGVILIFILNVSVGEADVHMRPIIGEVSKNSPAETAGLKTNDVLLSINKQPVHEFFDVVKDVRQAAGQHLEVVYQRGGKQFTTVLIPEANAAPTEVEGPDYLPTGKFEMQSRIGVRPGQPDVTYRRMPLTVAASDAISAPVKAIVIMGGLISQPARLKEAVGGPITMLEDTREAVKSGPADIIGLAAMLSISVGIFNLLPFPPLDGGQMAIALAEMLRRGRRLSMQVQNMAAGVGMFLVLLLVIFVFTIDIQRLGPHDDGFKPQANSKTAPKPAPSKP